MICIKDESRCCGCAACQSICPKGCITMQPGTLGAVFPHIDTSSCISCGRCEAVCPMLHEIPSAPQLPNNAFAAYAKDESVRLRGSSGGMFGVFARRLLHDNYLIYGAAFDSDLHLKCTRAETEQELLPLTKSKYLQSNAAGKYREIESELKRGRQVLFVSTPCQVAALKLFLGKEYEHLITVDFFCHGVPSQVFFDQCRSLVEAQKGCKIDGFEFRTKVKRGATPHYYTVFYAPGHTPESETRLYFDSPFYAAFQQYINLRESCYACKFAGEDRASDITIADFHDIERYVKGIDRFKGVSTVLIHTEKGRALWESCVDDLAIYPVDLQRLIEDGICFSGGTKRPLNRDTFIADYNTMPFPAFAEKYMNPNAYRKQRLYYAMPKHMRRIIKKLMKV